MLFLLTKKAPASLRGELSKWLQEIDSGVFIGKVNALVREELWAIIQKKIGTGEAEMFWTSNNEQGYDLKMINRTNYIPKNFEGVWLFGKVKK